MKESDVKFVKVPEEEYVKNLLWEKYLKDDPEIIYSPNYFYYYQDLKNAGLGYPRDIIIRCLKCSISMFLILENRFKLDLSRIPEIFPAHWKIKREKNDFYGNFCILSGPQPAIREDITLLPEILKNLGYPLEIVFDDSWLDFWEHPDTSFSKSDLSVYKNTDNKKSKKKKCK